LTVVRLLEFDWRDVAVLLVEPLVVEPVDVAQGGDLDLINGFPRPIRLDQLGLEQADYGLGEGVVERVSDRADRR